ncbi:MAG TPA: prepilin-type N-terminal cleavage/methylation domain-containing protein [Candidatus Paceibacterota bacterium]
MNKGFTLLEMLIVLVITAVICVGAITSLGRFRANTALDAAHQDTLTALHEARELTLSSKEATVYGVHFQTDKAVRFTGATYDAGATSNVTYLFDPRVRAVSISLSDGVSDVVFKRLTGETNATGTIVVAVYGKDMLRATTTVSSSGIIQ